MKTNNLNSKIMHEINFDLPYSDGVICDAYRPARTVIMRDYEERNLVYQMWEMFQERDLDINRREFYVDRVMFEANATLMHYLFAHEKGTYEEMMAAMIAD